MVLLFLGLGEVCGGQIHPVRQCLCPLAVPRRELPQPFPSFMLLFLLLLRPGSGPYLWVRLAGVRDQTFSGETAAISRSRLVFLGDKTSICLACHFQLQFSFACFHGGFTFIAQGISYPSNSLPLMLSIISYPFPQVNVALPEEYQSILQPND